MLFILNLSLLESLVIDHLFQVFSTLQVDSQQTLALGRHDLREVWLAFLVVKVGSRLLLDVLLTWFSFGVLFTVLKALFLDCFTGHSFVLVLLLLDHILQLVKVKLGCWHLRSWSAGIIILLLDSCMLHIVHVRIIANVAWIILSRFGTTMWISIALFSMSRVGADRSSCTVL